jgi:hypothetical protein
VPSPPPPHVETSPVRNSAEPNKSSQDTPNSGIASAQDCLDIQAPIHHLLAQEYVQDFKQSLIPTIARSPEFHNRLNDEIASRQDWKTC